LCAGAITAEQVFELQIAVQEALTNVLVHVEEPGLTNDIHLEVSCEDQVVQLEITYTGKAFDPAAVPLPSFDGARTNGFGLFIIEQLMDEVRNGQGLDGRSFIRLQKRLNVNRSIES
jgi:serine/threonine-protein kinase RsbW